jgi:hypothetical protein
MGMICIIPGEDFVVVKAINVVAKEDQGWNFKALKRSFTENRNQIKSIVFFIIYKPGDLYSQDQSRCCFSNCQDYLDSRDVGF